MSDLDSFSKLFLESDGAFILYFIQVFIANTFRISPDSRSFFTNMIIYFFQSTSLTRFKGKTMDSSRKELTNSKGEIDDPVVRDILRGKVCSYCTEQYYNNCMLHSNSESFGLLGLQPKLYDIFKILGEWTDSPIKTKAYASSLMARLAIFLVDLHFIVYDVHDYLANHLVDQFVETAQEMKQDAFKIFYINIVVTLLAMTLIRMIVLKKLERLDIGIRRILRIIPYKIIQENKVMSFYLNRVFNNELKVLQQFA